KGFKWELLTWWGIIGGAITLFVAISTTLKLADWARLVVQHWKELTHAFWMGVFGWLGIHLPPDWTPVLSFLLFGSLLTIGQALKFNRIIKNQPLFDRFDTQSFQLKSRRTLFCLILIIVNLTAVMLVFLITENLSGETMENVYVGIFLEMFITPPVIIVLFARHRLQAALSVVLMSMFYVIIVMVTQVSRPWNSNDATSSVTGFVLGWSLLPLIVLSVAPVKAVSRRLIFLA